MNKGSGCLGCLGILLLFGFFSWLVTDGLPVLIILLVGAIAIGLLYYYGKKSLKKSEIEKEEQERHQSNEKLVLRLAAKKEGYLTAAEVALESDFSLEEAEIFLEKLKAKRLCALRISDNGTYVYQFDMFLSPEEKKGSERI